MSIKFSIEQNILMTMSLMKSHNVKNVVISPGGTNVCLATSLLKDSYFNLYSCVDERSAAYIACGIAEETDSPVALCCTGATASRNYVPALTEAYYRKLPLLVITTSQHESKVGHLFPQVTDRWQQMNDIIYYSTHIPCRIDGSLNHWQYNVEINKALLTLTRNGGGPAHINLATDSSIDFSVDTLPIERVIKRIEVGDTLPDLTAKQIAIYVGNHKRWNTQLTNVVDSFCEKNNAVVLCDNTSGYHGRFRIESCIIATQTQFQSALLDIDLLIHIGDVSGSYMNLFPKRVWRVNPDGEVRDTFFKLEYVFQMSELFFFSQYLELSHVSNADSSYFKALTEEVERFRSVIPELPLSNAWIAQQTSGKLPHNSEVHFGILNSLRTWNFFHIDNSIDCFSNTGGFGIDGCLSSAIGSSFVYPNKIYYCILGDLAFFYDMNSIGNRHIKSNIRIILINNGCGAEFHIPACITKRAGFDGKLINEYTAASGHFGQKSPILVQHFAEDLGFEYIPVRTKKEYLDNIDTITSPEQLEKPLFVEVFTTSDDDAESMKELTTLIKSTKGIAKDIAKTLLGSKNIQRIKNTLGK